MAAINAVLETLKSGDHVLASNKVLHVYYLQHWIFGEIKSWFFAFFFLSERKANQFFQCKYQFHKKSTILERIFAVYLRKHEIYFKFYDIIWKIFLIWHTEVGLVQVFIIFPPLRIIKVEIYFFWIQHFTLKLT